MDYMNRKPDEIRQLIRRKQITGPTAGMCGGYAQANQIGRAHV